MKLIGIGNRIMCDDGIALHVLDKIHLNISKMHPDIKVIKGETDIVFGLNSINNEDFTVILDSTYFNINAGTVTLFSLESLNQYINKPFTQHDNNLLNILYHERRVTGYLIGIEIHKICFKSGISNLLYDKFEGICNKTLNKIKLVHSLTAGL